MLIERLTSPADGDRLEDAIPVLVEAIDQWELTGILADHPILIAVATPRAARVIRADQWGDLPPVGTDRLIEAVEASPSDVNSTLIVAGVAALLGPAGRKAHGEDAGMIRATGQIPILLLMIADPATMVATTVELPRPTRH